MKTPRLEFDPLFYSMKQGLASRGRTAEQFVTGSTAPFSGRRLPDLMFVPAGGAHAQQIHIVGLKATNVDTAPDLLVLAGIAGARRAVDANKAIPLRVAVAVSGRVTDDQRRAAKENGVELISAFTTPEQLTALIERWTGVDCQPSADVLHFLEMHGMVDHPGGQVESGALWRLGKLLSGPTVYVDYARDRGHVPAARNTYDGDVVIDRDASVGAVEQEWDSSVQAAIALGLQLGKAEYVRGGR